MSIENLFMDSPLWIKIMVGLFTIVSPAMSGSSLALQFKKKGKKHSECPLYSDMLKRDDIKAEIKEIERRTQIREQMSVVEASHMELIYEMKDVYSEVSNCKSDRKHYEKLVSLIENKKLKPIIRTWLKENHYTSRSEDNFSAYIVKKIGLLLRITKQELNDDYDDSIFAVPRKVLEEANESMLGSKAKEIWTQMFRDCREVARQNESKVLDLKKFLIGE